MFSARCIQTSLLILIATGVSRSQDSLSITRQWLPLAVGDRWIAASAESWRLEANSASGDDDYVWFQKGVGVTAERTFHTGT